MPEGDQERFEDYLELERYLAALQEDRRPPLSAELTPAQARLYRLAALLRAAAPGAAEPRPEFVAELRARLERELAAQEEGPSESAEAEAIGSSTESPSPTVEAPILPAASPPASSSPPPIERRSRLSRRRLLAGSAVAAASLVAGAGLDRALQEASGGPHGGTGQQATSGPTSTGPGAPPAYPALIGANVPSRWHFVAEVSALGKQPVRFVTETIAGYVIRQEHSPNRNTSSEYGSGAWSGGNESATATSGEEIIAFSAACTHMGCLVEWQESDGKFHCPCHGGVFTASGAADPTAGRLRYLAPLPRLDIRIEDGKIYVRIPATTSSS
ncbi:MAG: ubiquinol-cytochrome c reductase iron-sulfur subunit [Thermogemmatispora sp.]|uniref:QcrA and Rieske domain-containing protein n=1 Tax=Thermogemmatispora sp. TaxID=1968838 RepID=UPI00261D8C73|nr:ubiquinol-cytochrome c reductase iron-sulfur subunit [Thermogemmatispora sp.]MBX5456888.1 ubiquinol-cytochrome c reductase iron-sulfur subunit [Thermogemmatispora sp.]